MEDLIKVEEFLKVVASRDLNVQTLYFACTPTNVGDRDEALLQKGRRGGLEI